MSIKSAVAVSGIGRSIKHKRLLNIYANTGKGLFPFLLRKLRSLSAFISNFDVHPRVSAKTRTLLRRAEEALSRFEYYLSDKLSFIAQSERPRFHAVVLLVCATAAICGATMFSFGLKVTINGKYVGCVESIDDINKIVSDAESRVSAFTGKPYNLSVPINYSLSLYRKSDVINRDAVNQIILSSIDHLDSGNSYELYIDDSAVGSCDSFEALSMTLFRIACMQSGTNGEHKLSFTENVSVRSEEKPKQQTSLSDLTVKLLGNKTGVATYTVKPGDTLSAIALMYGVNPSDIKALNPGIKNDNIKIGQTLTVAEEVPYLQTRSVIQRSYVADIPFETKIEYTSSLYTNQTQIKRSGQLGKASVVADVEYINGVEAGRKILSYVVTREPVDQIKLVGTKALPAKAATGKFVSPASGRLTSRFGYRPSFRDVHTGIDIANSTGTSVKASDGGTVTFAGRKGNYGLCVIIDHGNGYTTLYAHNSKLLVKSGQKVAKREVIAKMGMTGRATGPHCHFEIRYKGVCKNPLNYISLY